uniref:Methyltransferase n=1 Tax=viral metagenome TaxID=1070528 RepID=A0A6C0LX61_9ZZZZ
MKYRDFKIKSFCGDILDLWENYIKNNVKEGGVIVEIGVHGGGSLLKTADLLINKNIKLFGIDCWENIEKIGINGIPNNFWTKSSLNKFLNLHKENYTNLINIINHYDYKFMKLIKGFSTGVVNKFNNNSIDAIYIDGDHSYEGVKNDLDLYYPKVKKGGLILLDDYTNILSVKKAVDDFCNKKNIRGEIATNKFYFYK